MSDKPLDVKAFQVTMGVFAAILVVVSLPIVVFGLLALLAR